MYIYNMKEIWKDIVEFEGYYQISTHGRVKSLDRIITRNNGINYTIKNRVMKLQDDIHGYKCVNLHKDFKQNTHRIHILVAVTFLGYEPDGTNRIVCDHINNIKTDNRVENLQLLSNRENISKGYKLHKTSSKYTGVYWYKPRSKWRSIIKVNGKRIYLGNFKSEKEASDVYQKALREIYT